MSNIDVLELDSVELTESMLSNLLEKKTSFLLRNVKDITCTVNQLEKSIERKHYRCRVYTEYRSSAIAAMAIPTGITQAVGFFTAIGIAAHNLATFNPDYEIAKNPVARTITVTYKR